MRRPPLPRLLAAAGLLAGAAAVAAAAQPAADKFPTAYLSTVPADGTFDARLKGLDLRPNHELPFFGYVRNPSEDAVKGTVTVLLTRDKDGKLPVAKGTLAGIEAGKSVRVPLTVVGSPTAPPPVPAKPGEPAPAPPPAPGVGLPDQLWLHTETAGEDGAVLRAIPQPLAAGILAPDAYVVVDPQPSFKLTEGGYELSVTLKDRQQGGPFRGPPAKVRLDLRPALLPKLDPTALKAGTYEGVVPPGGETVLTATRLRFGDKPSGVFAVSVDGFDRAHVFDVSPEGNNATAIKDGFTRLDLPAFAVPGRPLPMRVEVFQAPLGGRPVLTFQRSPTGPPQQLAADKPTLRDETRSLRAGEAGELLIATTVKDWVIPADTTGVYGRRTFKLETVPAVAKPADEVPVVFDDTPPAVKLVGLPPFKYVGTTLTVFADAADDESGVSEVVFYLGEPPGADGKLPAGSEQAKGQAYVPPKGARASGPLPPGRVTASFPLPETKGRVKVSVRATNNAGLSTTTDPLLLAVVDPPPPPKAKEKRTLGDIKVRVVQGSTPERPQPGLSVQLFTAAGAVVQSRTTDDKGEAVFKDLPPAAYLVYTVKLADLGAKGYTTASVTADKQTDVTVEVKR